MSVRRLQGIKSNSVIQYGFYTGVIRNKLIEIIFCADFEYSFTSASKVILFIG